MTTSTTPIASLTIRITRALVCYGISTIWVKGALAHRAKKRRVKQLYKSAGPLQYSQIFQEFSTLSTRVSRQSKSQDFAYLIPTQLPTNTLASD